MQALKKLALSLAVTVVVAFGLAGQNFAAETIKIGLLKVSGVGPV